MRMTSIIILLLISTELTNVQPELVIKDIPEDNIMFSKENLIEYIKKLDIQHPRVVMAQARIETANFTSLIFFENNNLFGMKFPTRRSTTAIGVNRNHSVYNNWMESVEDYKLWQSRIESKIDTREEYLSYLNKYYAEDKQYVKIIKQIIQ